MKIDIAAIARTALQAGSDLPAYLDLFELVKGLVSETDQATLQAAYMAARQRSDAEHKKSQGI